MECAAGLNGAKDEDRQFPSDHPSNLRPPGWIGNLRKRGYLAIVGERRIDRLQGDRSPPDDSGPRCVQRSRLVGPFANSATATLAFLGEGCVTLGSTFRARAGILHREPRG